jgi:glycosyltransferase involved in cell wall biosynthesis
VTSVAAITVVPQPAMLRGHLDTVTRDRISGWATGLEDGVPVALQVLDNGRPIARVLSNLYRPDLEAAGIGNGRHGFDVAVPGGLSPLSRHVIQVRREADGSELTGSPWLIEASDAFDDGLRQAVTLAVAGVNDAAEREAVLAFLAAQTDVLLQQRADGESQRQVRGEYERRVRRVGPAAAGLAPPQKRALVIDERVPQEGRDAGSQAMLSHVRALQALGHGVSLVAADDLSGELAAPDVTLCGAPFYASVEEVLRRQAHSFDVVYLHRASIAARYLNLVRQYQPRARLLYSVADLHHVRLERQAAAEERPELLAEARVMRLKECTAAWQADAVLTHSTEEAALLRRMVPEAHVHLVPWSIPILGTGLRPGAASFAARRGVAFIGNYGHEPNVDAARWLLEELMPLVWASVPQVPLLLVGAGMPEVLRRRVGAFAPDQVRAVGHVADLHGAVLNKVRLTVAPLRFGAGVKGKVLESLAAGVPCVMTPLAAEGIGFPAGLGGLVAADAAGLAAGIVRLHVDAREHARLAKAGLAFIGTACGEEVVKAALLAAIEGRRALLGAA